MNNHDIKVTITHNDVKPPNYDIDALKKNIEDSKKHVLMLQAEIDKQQASQKELKKLIKDQEKRNKQSSTFQESIPTSPRLCGASRPPGR